MSDSQNNAQLKQYRIDKDKSSLRAGLEGAVIGFGVSFLGGGLLQRRYLHIRNLPMPTKAMLVVAPTVGLGLFSALQRGVEFEHEHYDDDAAEMMDDDEKARKKMWDQLTNVEKTHAWMKEHKLVSVLGSWAGSMVLSWLYIQTQPMSFAQKLVQARVWAQGITVASMIGVAALTAIPSKGDKIIKADKDVANYTNSWEQVVKMAEEEGKLNSSKKPASQ